MNNCLEVTITQGGAFVASWWWGQDLFEWSFIHPYLLQETPSSLTPKSEGSGGRACCWTLGPVYRRGWTRSRLGKHWGPLNMSEWAQLYSRPSESQQSAENQNNVKGPADGEIDDLGFTMFSLSDKYNWACLKGLLIHKHRKMVECILNGGLTTDFELYVHVQPRRAFQSTFCWEMTRDIKLVNFAPPQNCMVSDHRTLSWHSVFEDTWTKVKDRPLAFLSLITWGHMVVKKGRQITELWGGGGGENES